MVGFFPTIYEDELLYSAIARYHIRSGNISIKATTEELFGSMTISSVVELPANINAFINNLPVNTKYTAEEIIQKHTMFPLYTAFLPQERAKLIQQSMKTNGGGDIYNRIGLMASSIGSNRFLKFCPKCFQEDMESIGEAYWHRIHQIPGIHVCAKHRIPLMNSQVLLRTENKHEFICATEEKCLSSNGDIEETPLERASFEAVEKIMAVKDSFEKLCILIKNVGLLLNRQYNWRPSMWFWKNYNNKLIELGLANVNGQVNQKELISSFKAYYGDDFLSFMQSNIEDDNESHWLSQIVRKPRKSFHPIRHLLIMQFLNISLEEVFSEKVENKPFGEGPWPCLNTGAEHYLQPIIENTTITYDPKSKKTVGTFVCDCGFIYSRSGPDVNKEDRFKFGRIKNYGSVWEEKLRELTEQNLSLREMARRLKADPKTIDKYAKKLGLDRRWRKEEDKEADKEEEKEEEIIDEGKVRKGENDLQIQKYRTEWLDLAEKYPNKSKTELRNLNQKLYAWLYRNDKEWITKFRTNSEKRRIIKNRINWRKRDKKILEQVVDAVEKLLNVEGKPVRITISKVGKEIGQLSLFEKHLEKLPLTKEYLDKHIEQVEDFQKRRIKWVISELEKDGEEITEWKVMKKAGIKEFNEFEVNSYIKSSIQDANKIRVYGDEFNG